MQTEYIIFTTSTDGIVDIPVGMFIEVSRRTFLHENVQLCFRLLRFQRIYFYRIGVDYLRYNSKRQWAWIFCYLQMINWEILLFTLQNGLCCHTDIQESDKNISQLREFRKSSGHLSVSGLKQVYYSIKHYRLSIVIL